MNTTTITLTLDNYGEGQRKHLFTAIKIFTLDLLALLYTFAIHYDAVLQGTFVIDTCVTGREEQQTISANIMNECYSPLSSFPTNRSFSSL